MRKSYIITQGWAHRKNYEVRHDALSKGGLKSENTHYQKLITWFIMVIE